MRQLDITGERYGLLIAIERMKDTANSRWRFQCDCGNETTAILTNVRQGQIKSCGCAGSRTTIGVRSLKHGHSVGHRKSRTAASWRNAKARCFNKNLPHWPDYGGRGITMSREWIDDFSAFLRDMGECPEGHSLDRVDVNGNYEAGNCRWATRDVQANNKRDTIRVGDLSLTQFAESVGFKYKRLHYRMNRYGETAHQAINWFVTHQRLERNRTRAGRD